MTIDSLSPRGRQLAASIARTLTLVQEHGKAHPNEALALAMFMLNHTRSCWPQVFLNLEQLP